MTTTAVSFRTQGKLEVQPLDNTTIEQRASAFEGARAILALERMVEPSGYDRLKQAVIAGNLSIPAAVAIVIRHAGLPMT